MKLAALHLVLFVTGVNLPSIVAGDGLVDLSILSAEHRAEVRAEAQAAWLASQEEASLCLETDGPSGMAAPAATPDTLIYAQLAR